MTTKFFNKKDDEGGGHVEKDQTASAEVAPRTPPRRASPIVQIPPAIPDSDVNIVLPPSNQDVLQR